VMGSCKSNSNMVTTGPNRNAVKLSNTEKSGAAKADDSTWQLVVAATEAAGKIGFGVVCGLSDRNASWVL